MTTECHDSSCGWHGCHIGGDEPFCYEAYCRKAPKGRETGLRCFGCPDVAYLDCLFCQGFLPNPLGRIAESPGTCRIEQPILLKEPPSSGKEFCRICGKPLLTANAKRCGYFYFCSHKCFNTFYNRKES